MITASKSHDTRILLISAAIPIPTIYHGRGALLEVIVENILHRRSSDEHLHIPVLGSGGIGETSIELTIVHYSWIVEAFGEHRYWVPCDRSQALPLLSDYLLKTLSVAMQSGDPVKDIILHLRSAPCARLVVVISNFETCWRDPLCSSDPPPFSETEC